MKYKWLLFLGFGIYACADTAPAPVAGLTQAGAAVQQELLGTIQDFNAFFVQADVTALEAMVTENYLHSENGAAPLDREAWLQVMRERRAQLATRSLVIQQYEMREFVMQYYGDAAVVNGINITKGKKGNTAFTDKVRFMHLWVKKDGTWKRAAFQDTKID